MTDTSGFKVSNGGRIRGIIGNFWWAGVIQKTTMKQKRFNEEKTSSHKSIFLDHRNKVLHCKNTFCSRHTLSNLADVAAMHLQLISSFFAITVTINFGSPKSQILCQIKKILQVKFQPLCLQSLILKNQIESHI